MRVHQRVTAMNLASVPCRSYQHKCIDLATRRPIRPCKGAAIQGGSALA